MRLEFITIESPFYKVAVAIRIKLFFDKMTNSLVLIEDAFEAEGIHVVCIDDNEVVGTGRLHIEKNIGVISQMAIPSHYQNKGIGSRILKALIEKSKVLGATSIKLSARETAITFYKKFDFKAIGEKYPSKKTGIIHRQMKLMIK